VNSLNAGQIRSMFDYVDIESATKVVEDSVGLGLPLIGPDSTTLLERIRSSVIRLSAGDLGRLKEAARLAREDWRDVLLAAGFGTDVRAHASWQPRRLLPSDRAAWRAGKNDVRVQYALGSKVECRLHRGRMAIGDVADLLTLEPEPRYLVGLDGGRVMEVRQSAIRSREPGAGNAG
jgi:hypothetical protein